VFLRSDALAAQVRKASRQLLAVVQLALRSAPSLPCLCNRERTVHDLRARLHLQVLVFESLCAMQVGSKLTLSRAG
jgi:hypothetical protein